MARLIEFTSAETKVINTAWLNLLGTIESSWRQEKRLRDCYKVEVKNFGPVCAKVHIISQVLKGMANAPDALRDVCDEDAERVLAFAVGAYIAKQYPEKTLALGVELNKGYNAYSVAQQRWQGSL